MTTLISALERSIEAIRSSINHVNSWMKSRDRCDWGVFIVVIIAVLVYSLFFHFEHYPFHRVGYDTYNHLGVIRAFQYELGPGHINSNLFPAMLLETAHAGVYFLCAAGLSSMLNTSPPNVLYLMGAMNIFLILTAFYALSIRIAGNKNIGLISVVVFLSFTSAHTWQGTSMFALPDLLIMAHYPSIFGVAIAFFTLCACFDYLKDSKMTSLVLVFILFAVTFNSHMLTGYILGLTIALLLFADLWNHKKVRREQLHVAIMPALASIACLLWPYYNWVKILLASSPIQRDAAPTDIYSLSFTIDVLRLQDVGAILLIVGVVFILKYRNHFLILWTIAMSSLALSFLLPLRPPLYWRFTPFIKIPLFIGFGIFFLEYLGKGKKERLAALLILILVVTFPMATTIDSQITPSLSGDNAYLRYSFLAQAYDSPLVIITYESLESYAIQGMTSLQTPTVPFDHYGNPTHWPEIDRRERLIKEFYVCPTIVTWSTMVTEFPVDLVLISNHSKVYSPDDVISFLCSIGGTLAYCGASYSLVEI